MGIKKHWLIGQTFARSFKRTIDRETLLDLLGIVVYEANRAAQLEDAGREDVGSSVDCLFDFVLDALQVPEESASFSRRPFEEIFYNDFWLENKHPSLDAALSAMETLRDVSLDRASKAEAQRAGFRLVED